MKKELVLGTAQLGMNYGINNRDGKPSIEKAFKILDMAYEKGIRILDTASSYGNAEIIIGKYMNQKNRHFKIATKLAGYEGKSKIEAYVNSQIRQSLKRLNIPQIDYYFIHSFRDIIKHPGIIETLKRHEEAGKIVKIGVSIYDVEELEYILDNLAFVNAVQIPFNLLDLRWIKQGILSKTKDRGIEIFTRSIFLQGFLFLDKYTAIKIHHKSYSYLQLLKKFCSTNNISIDALAITFVKLQKEIDYIIIGCENRDQLIANINNFNTRNQLSEKELLNFVIQNFSSIEKQIIDPRKWSKF